MAAGITKLVGVDITNSILRTADGTDFKTVDEYDIVLLINAIVDDAKRPEAANIRRHFFNLAATQFDFRERLATNIEQFLTLAAKSTFYGIMVHGDVKAAVILANVEWAVHQS